MYFNGITDNNAYFCAKLAANVVRCTIRRVDRRRCNIAQPLCSSPVLTGVEYADDLCSAFQ